MTTFYNEWDKKTAAWLRELCKQGLVTNGVVDERSITELRGEDLRGYGRVHLFAGIAGWDYALRLAGFPDDRVVWTGSCPCQPFSAAGKRKGQADERHLWPEMFRLIGECRPDTIFGEQVGSPEALAWWDQVASDLESIGYSCWADRLDARCFGFEQERRRVYWCANTIGVRQPQPWQHWEDACYQPASEDREADWFVDAVRRKTLPYLCPVVDGIRPRVGEVCVSGAGNAVIPQVAAAFVRAFMESEAHQ
jgi:DNA (cytosine-5)-methyltransferase 1